MSDDEIISFGDVIGFAFVVIGFLLFILFIIIFIPLGAFYLMWNEFFRPRDVIEVLGTLLFGGMIEAGVLFIQITTIYPWIWSMIT